MVAFSKPALLGGLMLVIASYVDSFGQFSKLTNNRLDMNEKALYMKPKGDGAWQNDEYLENLSRGCWSQKLPSDLKSRNGSGVRGGVEGFLNGLSKNIRHEKEKPKSQPFILDIEGILPEEEAFQ